MRKISNWVFTLILIAIVYLIYVGQTAAYNRPYWHYGTLTKLVPIEYEASDPDVEIVNYRYVEDQVGLLIEKLGVDRGQTHITILPRYNVGWYDRDKAAMLQLLDTFFLWTDYIPHLPHLRDELVENLPQSFCSDFACVSNASVVENNVIGLKESAVKAHEERVAKEGTYLLPMHHAVYPDRTYRIGALEFRFDRPRYGHYIGDYYLGTYGDTSYTYEDVPMARPVILGAMSHRAEKEDGTREELDVVVFLVELPGCYQSMIAFAYTVDGGVEVLQPDLEKINCSDGWGHKVSRVGNYLRFKDSDGYQDIALPGNYFE